MRRIVLAGAMAIALPLMAAGQEADFEEAPPVETDDRAMEVRPPARSKARNPTADHVAFMRSLDEANLGRSSKRQNDIAEARRVADIDLFWGLR